MMIGVIYVLVTKALGIVAATFVTYLGYKLFVRGVEGKASLVANADRRFELQLLNASPGLFFLLGGAVVLGLLVFETSYTDVRKLPDGTIASVVAKGNGLHFDVVSLLGKDLYQDAEAGQQMDITRRCEKLESAILLFESASKQDVNDKTLKNIEENKAKAKKAYIKLNCK